MGASYFRALGKGQKYGLSARGLAIDTAVQTGEEFPVFKEFWIERPQRRAAEIKVYALLDSPSISGAYSFVIQPGLSTTIDVEAVLFPRKPINKLGVAPLTSMFLFGETTSINLTIIVPRFTTATVCCNGTAMTNGCGGRWTIRNICASALLKTIIPKGSV